MNTLFVAANMKAKRVIIQWNPLKLKKFPPSFQLKPFGKHPPY